MGPLKDLDVEIAQVSHLREWLKELYVDAAVDRRLVASREVEGGPTVLGDLEVLVGAWSVAAARVQKRRHFGPSDVFVKSLRRSVFETPTVRALFLEDGLFLLKNYVEAVEMLRIALLALFEAEAQAEQ